MTDDNIRISDESKAQLDEIKDNYYRHTTLTYSEAVDVLVAEYMSEATEDDVQEDSESVRHTNAGGDQETSDEDDDFPGDGSVSAAEKADQFRVD